MTAPLMPRYPVYVISKGRFEHCLTAQFLIADAVPFTLVVEPQEADAYAARFGAERLLITPFSNLGLGSIPVRNFVWEHARASGALRHWILDDNISDIRRRWKMRRIPCHAGIALRCAEDFTDRYTNVAIAGLTYYNNCVPGEPQPPFYLNNHVYSCLLIDNALPHRWRGRYNEDTDLCLQVLSAGLCTVLINAFMIRKRMTMTMRGGNTTELYQGDGRLKMARALERMWPGIVTVKRRYRRPQHVIAYQWDRFDTPLIPKPNVDLSALDANEYGLDLLQVAPITSPELLDLIAGRARPLPDADGAHAPDTPQRGTSRPRRRKGPGPKLPEHPA